MIIKRHLLIMCLFLPFLAMADVLQIKPDAPTSYVVKKGDTLWDISAIFLNQPWLWPKLWRLNPQIKNPHLIYPGDKLRLVYDEQGQPMLVKGKPEIKWSPKVRTKLKDQTAISTISLDVIAPYLRYESFFTEQELALLPYVLGSEEAYKSSIDGFNFYVKGDLEVGRSYAVYEKGQALYDPASEELLGYQVHLVATGQALRTGNIGEKVPSTLYVNDIQQEIHAGDFVVPVNQGQLLPSYFTMQAVSGDVRGAIIQSASGVREFGKSEVVMINRGTADNVRPGDVMTIKRTSPSVVESSSGPVYTEDAPRWSRMLNAGESDYQMPEESLGQVMVFKAYDKVSMALILKSSKAVRLQDAVTAP